MENVSRAKQCFSLFFYVDCKCKIHRYALIISVSENRKGVSFYSFDSSSDNKYTRFQYAVWTFFFFNAVQVTTGDPMRELIKMNSLTELSAANSIFIEKKKNTIPIVLKSSVHTYISQYTYYYAEL